MLRKSCQYYPCHNDMDDCDMCYCFLYPCEIPETGGKYIQGKNNEKIWDCSDCTIVHKKEFLSHLRQICLKELLLFPSSFCNHNLNGSSGIPIKVGKDFLIKFYCEEGGKYVYKEFKDKVSFNIK